MENNEKYILNGTSFFDEVDSRYGCTVQILRNSVTGETSVGWWEEDIVPKVAKFIYYFLGKDAYPCNYNNLYEKLGLTCSDTCNADGKMTSECWEKWIRMYLDGEIGVLSDETNEG